MHRSIYMHFLAAILSGSLLTSCPKTVASLLVASHGTKTWKNPFAITTSNSAPRGDSCPATTSLSASATPSQDSDSESRNGGSDSVVQRIFGRSSIVDPYHLIWSPGFVQKSATAAALMVSARYAANILALPAWSTILPALSPTFASVLGNVGLPLLASACCLLQLGLNVLSIGCAGFNTFLGPLRPYFMAVLLVLSLRSGIMGASMWTSRYMMTMLMRWTVALLPEGLYLFNKYVMEGVRGASNESVSVGMLRAQVELDVPTMGCVACINSIDNALKRQVGVRQATASLHSHKKGGMAMIEVVGASKEEVDERVSKLCGVVEMAGFGGCVAKTVDMAKIKDVP